MLLIESGKKLLNVMKTDDPSVPPPTVDRRRHDRTLFPVPVQIISHGVFGDKSYDGVCTDTSLDGLAFETEAELFLQNVVELLFEIENKTIVRRSARLLYRVGQKYGAYFVRPE